MSGAIVATSVGGWLWLSAPMSLPICIGSGAVSQICPNRSSAVDACIVRGGLSSLLGPSHLHRDACSQVILAIFNYNDDDVPAAPAALVNEAEEEV